MNKITKFITTLIVFALIVSFTTLGFAEANGYPSQEEIKNDPRTIELTKEEIAQNKDIVFDDTDEPVMIPRVLPAIPFVASAVFGILAKQGVKTFVKSISKHALQRAGQRGITKHMMANTLKNGTKYTDKKTGAKILYDKKTGTTLVIKGNKVVTTYKQKKPKKVWRKGH
ncbi:MULTISPECIES: DUF4258 domain-containing protein [Staphylococcus]|uniref:DUF4258 domain-containing protein n=1 Tax=Staphylococcus lutrae TaxID=155085 RepID=A0AAC9WJE2_9STAP|nr:MULTISPECIES: DUF4258 domain-containing protein [Staphylococcus]ARJ50928.1 hypothetical protein B5P37_06135 [Staphylococcus lutrae]MDU0286121.1 DUF4258 domain-containing protein [Staphylococcus pseudintermedius]PNZ34184.1 hypothetical protein CD134_11255 [Staphylococcus lutrae]